MDEELKQEIIKLMQGEEIRELVREIIEDYEEEKRLNIC
jgi:hypothetical protein